jgi:NAD(P)-dependent dehydrogenase (short-subunit alcohol dehydrogenase family)
MKQQTVLITGASRGLGYDLTKKYLEDGNIVFAAVREVTAPKLIILKEEYPDSLIPLKLEVTDTLSINDAAILVGEYTDKIDILINNAAIHSDTSFEILENANIDDCLGVYDVNAIGPIRVVKAFINMLRNSASGKVINISSESGSISTCRREKEFDYCMSKAALNMGTKLLSNYLKKDNITVLSVHPGWMRTDMGGQNAHLDPYETACKLVELFNEMPTEEHPMFIDNNGIEFPW